MRLSLCLLAGDDHLRRPWSTFSKEPRLEHLVVCNMLIKRLGKHLSYVHHLCLQYGALVCRAYTGILQLPFIFCAGQCRN